MSPGNIIVLSGVISLVLWGTSGLSHGIKWTWHNKGCIVHHGVKACKAKSAAAKPMALGVNRRRAAGD